MDEPTKKRKWIGRLGHFFLRLILGLFVVWQIVFLPATNIVGYLPSLRPDLKKEPLAQRWLPGWLAKKGRLYEALEKAKIVFDRWEEATGQPESWSLFAPNVWTDTLFISVEFSWLDEDTARRVISRRLALLAPGLPLAAAFPALAADDESIGKTPPAYILLSDNEPGDIYHYLRFGKCRIRQYESKLEVNLSRDPDDTDDEVAAEWKDKIFDKVGSHWDNMQLYLRYRLRCFEREHPDMPPPKQITLHVRHYSISPPGTDPFVWVGPDEQPLARWRPDVPVDEDFKPIEAYNPVTGCFERLPMSKN